MGRLNHPALAVLGGVAGVVLAVTGHPAAAGLSILGGSAVGIAATDLAERRIPTVLVRIAAAFTLLAVGATSLIDASARPLLLGGAGAGLIGGAFLIVHLVAPHGLGFGDVRLAAVVGAVCAASTDTVVAPVIAAIAASAAAAVAMLARRQSTVPFGPFLLAAAIVVIGAVAVLA